MKVSRIFSEERIISRKYELSTRAMQEATGLVETDFVVVDVETANADLASICQIGIASFHDGALASSWASLVNPQDHFSRVNVSIHGIDDRCVRDAPNWAQISPEVTSRLRDCVVVSHTQFDLHALRRAYSRFNELLCTCMWLDSATVTRRAWPQFAQSGYGLSDMARYLGIEYRAHDALEDARCAGEVLLKAMAETGLSLKYWTDSMGHSLNHECLHPSCQQTKSYANWPPACRREGDLEGKLFGEILVFTGTLSISRSDAADVASVAGCKVEDTVTKRTTILVVGDEDIRVLNGHQTSTKHRKAESLIAKGLPIRILGESDYRMIVGLAPLIPAS